ncbi:UNVERIFIED_CONTAM: ABC transporter transmembrane domain-containing protein [Campylobacter lari]
MDFDFSNYALFVALLGLAYAFQKILKIFQSFLLNRINILIGSKIRHSAYQKIQKMPLSFFDQEKTGDLMSALTNDIANFVRSATDMASTSITVIFTLIISLFFMFYYLPIVALVAIVVIPINFLPIFFIVRKNMKNYIEKQQRLGEFNAYLEEILDAMPLINIHQQQKAVAKEFNKFNQSLLDPSLKIGRRNMLT